MAAKKKVTRTAKDLKSAKRLPAIKPLKRGPESALDNPGYSRPFPPHT